MKVMGVKPAMLDRFGKGNKKVAGDVEGLELGETANRIWKSFELIRMNI